MKYGVGSLLAPLAIGGVGWFNVPLNYSAVVTRFGKIEDMVGPGLHWRLLPGRKINLIYTGLNSIHADNCNVIDGDGKPIVLSSTVNTRVTNPIAFAQIYGGWEYLERQAEITMKQVAMNHQYEGSLRTDPSDVCLEMVEDLTDRVNDIGISVENISITDIAYSKEVAAQMLAKQQAVAVTEARDQLVKATVDIVKSIKNELGSELGDESKEKLAMNLVMLMMTQTNATPVIKLD